MSSRMHYFCLVCVWLLLPSLSSTYLAGKEGKNSNEKKEAAKSKKSFVIEGKILVVLRQYPLLVTALLLLLGSAIGFLKGRFFLFDQKKRLLNNNSSQSAKDRKLEKKNNEANFFQVVIEGNLSIHFSCFQKKRVIKNSNKKKFSFVIQNQSLTISSSENSIEKGEVQLPSSAILNKITLCSGAQLTLNDAVLQEHAIIKIEKGSKLFYGLSKEQSEQLKLRIMCNGGKVVFSQKVYFAALQLEIKEKGSIVFQKEITIAATDKRHKEEKKNTLQGGSFRCIVHAQTLLHLQGNITADVFYLEEKKDAEGSLLIGVIIKTHEREYRSLHCRAGFERVNSEIRCKSVIINSAGKNKIKMGNFCISDSMKFQQSGNSSIDINKLYVLTIAIIQEKEGNILINNLCVGNKIELKQCKKSKMIISHLRDNYSSRGVKEKEKLEIYIYQLGEGKIECTQMCECDMNSFLLMQNNNQAIIEAKFLTLYANKVNICAEGNIKIMRIDTSFLNFKIKKKALLQLDTFTLSNIEKESKDDERVITVEGTMIIKELAILESKLKEKEKITLKGDGNVSGLLEEAALFRREKKSISN